MSETGTCPCNLTEVHPATECVAPWETSTDIQQRDMAAILDALGLGDHARPYSIHAIVHREILPAINVQFYGVERTPVCHMCQTTHRQDAGEGCEWVNYSEWLTANRTREDR